MLVLQVLYCICFKTKMKVVYPTWIPEMRLKKSPAASKEVISDTGSTRFPGWKEHSIALVVAEKEFVPPAPAHISPKKVPFWWLEDGDQAFCQPHLTESREGWVPKNWCFWIVVLEETLESPLHSKEIKPVNLKVNQPWIFIGRTDAEAPILWPPDAKSWLTGKDLDAGKDWGQEKGLTEDEMVGWHHWVSGHEFEQTSRDNEGWGSLVCCNPQGHKELDTADQLKNNNSSNKQTNKKICNSLNSVSSK